MSKKITIAFGIDVDAVGGWLGSYGGEDSPGDISRGVFAGEIGIPRLVNLLKSTISPQPSSGRGIPLKRSLSSST